MSALNIIDHRDLKMLVEAGAVRAVQVVGQNDGWYVVVKTGQVEKILAAVRSNNARIFKKLETVRSHLRGLGIADFEVHGANYSDHPSIKERRA